MRPTLSEGTHPGSRWLSEPPWTLELLHNLRDLTDPDGRRRGPQVAHGSHAATDVMGIMVGYINPQLTVIDGSRAPRIEAARSIQQQCIQTIDFQGEIRRGRASRVLLTA